MVAIDRAAAVVDDEGLVGEIQRQPGDLLGLVRIQRELEEPTVATEQRNAAAKRRFISDARPQREAFGRFGRMPAQHLSVAQYVVQGLIIVETVALPLIRASLRRAS